MIIPYQSELTEEEIKKADRVIGFLYTQFSIIRDVYSHIDLPTSFILNIMVVLRKINSQDNPPDISSIAFDLNMTFGKTKRGLKKLESAGLIKMKKKGRRYFVKATNNLSNSKIGLKNEQIRRYTYRRFINLDVDKLE